LLQLKFWPSIQPFAWSLFYPTVLISASLGGLIPGLVTTIISTALVWYYFLPPEGSFSLSEKANLASVFVFLGTGAAFSIFHEMLRRAQLRQTSFNERRKRDVLLRQFVEQSPFSIAMFDKEMRYIFASQRWMSGYRLTKSDLRGKSHYETFPDLPEHWKEVHKRCLEGAAESNEADAIVRTDGTTGWIRWEVRPWRDDQGQVGGLIVFSEDVSDRVNARHTLEKLNEELEIKFRERTAELVRSERKYRTMFESAYDSLLVTDSAGRILMVNEQLIKKFGYQPGEIVGKPVEILLPERFRRAHVAKRDGYVRNPLPRPMGLGGELYGRRKDGSEFPVEVALNQINTTDGTETHAVIRDITERKESEEHESFLADFSKTLSETFGYQERLQVAADLIVPKVADICVVSMLDANELTFTAIAVQDQTERQVLQSYTKHIQATQGNSRYTVEHVIQTGKPLLVENVETELLVKTDLDAEQRLRLELIGATSFVCFPLIPRGVIVGTITLVMTGSGRGFQQKEMKYLELIANRCAVAVENAKLYFEAQEATKVRELVLSIVAHELLNPIGVINMIGQILEMEQVPKVKNMNLLAGRILRSTTMMQRLISDLLDFGTIQAGTLKIEQASVPVSIIVATAMESMSPRAKEKKQHLRLEISDDIPDIFCDQGRIVQVLWNLIGNAIKFTPNEGVIIINAFADAKVVQFTITDSGPGLEAHELAKVFERFWQSGKSAKSSAGLGLAISKGLVEAHGGKIWVESEKNHGCSFHFVIPIANPS